MAEVCTDNRFEIIAKAKADLLESTNIETSADEMACLDSFLFRCWQMGWLRRYEEEERKWIPFAFRELDEEEKEEHPDWCYIMWNTPEHGQEILVSNGKWVWADTFYDDDGCYLDSDSDMEGCAWMPMPKPWKGEGDE